MKLYFVRHGQSHVNLKDWDGGNQDMPLTELGRRQATSLGYWFKQYVPWVDAIYSSTMERARETAELAAGHYGIDIQLDDRLREIGNNKADHTPWPKEGLPSYGDFWGSERPFESITPSSEGGESLMHFRTRLGMFIEEALRGHRGKVVMAFCHGGVIDIAFDYLFNVGFWRRCEARTMNTGVTLVEYVELPQREVWRIYYHNKTEHLATMMPKGAELVVNPLQEEGDIPNETY
ncbi:MAG TPA: histidine phosphatase family protein [Anaerolineae bacterium]|nr:histidine phosphatase family protein [Anaerolineae bacterium]